MFADTWGVFIPLPDVRNDNVHFYENVCAEEAKCKDWW